MALLICLIFSARARRAREKYKYDTTPRAYIFQGASCTIAAAGAGGTCSDRDRRIQTVKLLIEFYLFPGVRRKKAVKIAEYKSQYI